MTHDSTTDDILGAEMTAPEAEYNDHTAHEDDDEEWDAGEDLDKLARLTEIEDLEAAMQTLESGISSELDFKMLLAVRAEYERFTGEAAPPLNVECPGNQGDTLKGDIEGQIRKQKELEDFMKDPDHSYDQWMEIQRAQLVDSTAEAPEATVGEQVGNDSVATNLENSLMREDNGDAEAPAGTPNPTTDKTSTEGQTTGNIQNTLKANRKRNNVVTRAMIDVQCHNDDAAGWEEMTTKQKRKILKRWLKLCTDEQWEEEDRDNLKIGITPLLVCTGYEDFLRNERLVKTKAGPQPYRTLAQLNEARAFSMESEDSGSNGSGSGNDSQEDEAQHFGSKYKEMPKPKTIFRDQHGNQVYDLGPEFLQAFKDLRKANKEEFSTEGISVTIDETTKKVTHIMGKEIGSKTLAQKDARQLPKDVRECVKELYKLPLYRKAPCKSKLHERMPSKFHQWFTDRGDFAHSSPLREFSAAELGMHDEMYAHFNNNMRRQKDTGSDQYKSGRFNLPNEYGARLTLQTRNQDGTMAKNKLESSKKTEISDGAFDPGNGGRDSPLIVKGAILYAIKNGLVTAADLQMERVGAVWKNLHAASLAVLERQLELEQWVNEQRALISTRVKVYKKQSYEYQDKAKAIQDVNREMRDFLNMDTVKDALKAVGLEDQVRQKWLEDLPTSLKVQKGRRNRATLPGHDRRMKEYKQLRKDMEGLKPLKPTLKIAGVVKDSDNEGSATEDEPTKGKAPAKQKKTAGDSRSRVTTTAGKRKASAASKKTAAKRKRGNSPVLPSSDEVPERPRTKKKAAPTRSKIVNRVLHPDDDTFV